ETIDLSASAAGSPSAIEQWRSGSKAADRGWEEAGIKSLKTLETMRDSKLPDKNQSYAEGMIVKHESYGSGRVTEVSGYGVLRKVKVRFSLAGERTFLADKAKLLVVPKATGR